MLENNVKKQDWKYLHIQDSKRKKEERKTEFYHSTKNVDRLDN